ncbi:dihydrodipicolinate synthase family protein [Streptosporangium amethystogenes]|uniref:dihydrodipicolinate synthase family protein n=1 Tax=Streptosporangium amethystogenes TaxID=2002 RepID=UPI0007C6887C|nr:dihydrodipicolinate synthase family protein [Streptosporangium amethystogenes]
MAPPPPVRLIAAPFTPMCADGALNLSVVPAQAAHLAGSGVAGVFVGGTTGEWPSLTVDERTRLAVSWLRARDDLRDSSRAGVRDDDGTRDDLRDGLEVIVHVGHDNVREARALAAHAESTGANAIAALPPHFFRPRTVAELVELCGRIAGAAPTLPFLYYHIPSMSGVDLPITQFVRAAREHIPTFAGVKFTDYRLADFDRCLQESVRLCFGRDEILLAALALGATEAVGSTYNFAAPLFHRLARAHADGDLVTARRLQSLVRQAVDVCETFGGLPALKTAASMLGPELGPCRAPLRPVDRDALRAELDRLGLLEACGTGGGAEPRNVRP